MLQVRTYALLQSFSCHPFVPVTGVLLSLAAKDQHLEAGTAGVMVAGSAETSMLHEIASLRWMFVAASIGISMCVCSNYYELV